MTTAVTSISGPSESLLSLPQQNDRHGQGNCILDYEGLKAQGSQILHLVKIAQSVEFRMKQQSAGEVVVEGVSLGAVTTAVALSFWNPLAALTVGVAALYTYNNSESISSAVKSSANSVSRVVHGGASSQPGSTTFNDAVSIWFDPCSSGLGGSVRGRPSTTVGDFKIKLGRGSELTYRFNLNGDPIISRADLLLLFETLYSKVIDHELFPDNCIQVLDGLNALIELNKASRTYEPDKTLSFPQGGSNFLYPFDFLRKLCEAKIACDPSKYRQ